MRTIKLVLFLALISFIQACNQQSNNKDINSISALNPYVFAYSSGVISRNSPITVEFTDQVVENEDVGTSADPKIVSFTPSISGELIWENIRTLKFIPENYLESSNTYTAKVNVSKIFNKAKGENSSFEFEFRTKDQNIEVEVENLQATNVKDLSKQELIGTVYTTDVAEIEAIETLLEAKQAGKNLSIEWNHQDELSHQFIIKGIDRGKNPSNVALNWNGKSISAKDQGSEKVEVPAIGDFKISTVEAFHDPEQYALIQFSDPLSTRQNLQGLVELEAYDGNLRFTIDRNQIRVYPVNRLSGAYKLKVNPGIKNINNAKMKGNGSWDLVFEEIKPKVRLVGRGVIMPSTDGLILPFEAIGLNAVELEVFKIYNNNILQYLQSNKINGNYQLNAVGRIVLQKKIDLQSLNPNSNNQRWMRYALDLKDLFDQDAEAIYQVRLGFRPGYSSLACDDPSRLNAAPARAYDPDNIKSIMDSWYGINGYYNGYDWDNRDNPCYPEYYNSDRFVRRNVLASNLGIISKMGPNKTLTAIITDLRTAKPVANAEVKVYDYQQQLIGTATSDGNGFANLSVDHKPFVLLAKQGKESGYLRLADGDALSLSRFDINGAVVQKGLKGYMYGDRGVWRPGDSIFLNFVLNDKANELPKDYPINFEVYDSRGQLHLKRTLSYNVDQVYPMHFDTPKDAPTGNWSAQVKVGGASFYKRLKVETVKPNRLEIDLDFGREELSGRSNIKGDLNAKWLHGAPASNLNAIVEAQVRPSNTSFAKYPSFKFDDPARKFNNEGEVVLFDGALDANGNVSFEKQLLGSQSVPGKMRASFRTRVFEQGGDFSTDAFSIPYSPYDAYTGVEIPQNQYGEPRIEVNENGRLRFVSVDKDGKPIANRKLSVGFYRVQWRWWWDQGRDYVSRYNTSTHNQAQDRTELTTNGNGEASWTVKPNRWGRYLVRVCDLDGGHCGGSYFYAGYPWYGDDNDNGREVAAMLNFKSDKEKYTVNDEIKLTVPGGKEGQALVTLENGSEVIDRFWVSSKEGENIINFKAKPEMAPTVYAHVSLIQAHGQTNNDLPIRLYGVIPINVEDPATKLEPAIAMPTELRPEQEFTVEVSENNKKEMAYTLAIVDEGLLGLTRFKTPNPHQSFYAREALGIKTWDVYDNVLGAYGGELDRVLSIGGDAEEGNEEIDNTANRFEPVVRHLGPFKLDKGKKNKHKVKLPNYIGAVRVMVVASGEEAYGAAEKKVPVNNPVMVLTTLPRVLSPGDELKVPVNVFVSKDNIKRVKVSIKELSGLGNINGSSSQNVSFNSAGNELVEFDVKLRDGVGIAKFEITAEGGGASSSQEIEVQVRNPNPYQTEVFADVIEPGKEWSQNFDAVGMEGSNEAILEVSSIPPINLGRRLKYLLRYPYGCIEQTTSSAFPQLFVNKLMDLDDEQKAKIPENIKAAISRIKQFQTSNGGLAYWPGKSTPDHWGTNYAMHFLLEAKSIGYQVPDNTLKSLIKFQKKTAKLWSPKQEEYGFYSARSQQLNQAYRLYTLALAGSPDLSSMNRLREKDDLKLQARWRLAAAYVLAGKGNIAKELTQNSSTEVEEYKELSYTFGSNVRDWAMILETLTLLDDKDRSGKLVQDLSDALSAGRWLSTQSTAYSLMAIAKYVGFTETRSDFNFSYAFATNKNTDVFSETPVFQIDLGTPEEKANKVAFRNKSNAKLFVRLISSGQPRPGLEKGSSEDLEMDIEFVNTDGSALDVGNLPQGKDFVAVIKVKHPGNRLIRYEELALTQIFPSGWEIINQRMDGLSGAKQSSFDYQDIRDDRVNTFFDLRRNNSKTFRVTLNASYQGRYYLPATSCQAMYDNTISAYRVGQWVEVVAPGNS